MPLIEKPFAWIESLASQEIEMEKTGQMDVFSHLNEEKILEDHAYSFLSDLRELFQRCADHFNQFRKDSRQTIKVYGIANTKADFLVFRNGVKLVVSYSKPGQVEISFHTLSGGLYAPMQSRVASGKGKIPRPPGSLAEQVGDLFNVELGPFNEARWTFQGIKTTVPALVRFYLTEFIKNSAS